MPLGSARAEARMPTSAPHLIGWFIGQQPRFPRYSPWGSGSPQSTLHIPKLFRRVAPQAMLVLLFDFNFMTGFRPFLTVVFRDTCLVR